MDQRSSGSGSLVSIPKCLTQINIRLDSEKDIINTFKQIEQNHWNYLDNYRDGNRRRYPTLSIKEFAFEVIRAQTAHVRLEDVKNYLRLYCKHKKNIPTAGVVLYHYRDNVIYFVVVRMRFQKIWSMPKGKKEPNETIIQTARREFHEETGIDLEDLVMEDTPRHKIERTWFYLIEADQMTFNFEGFNAKEVEEVKWVSATSVIRSSIRYSKQTVAAAKYLLSRP